MPPCKDCIGCCRNCGAVPPQRRTAAHLAEFYRFLHKQRPDLLRFPANAGPARELARILHGHLSR